MRVEHETGPSQAPMQVGDVAVNDRDHGPTPRTSFAYSAEDIGGRDLAVWADRWKDLSDRALAPNAFSDPAVVAALQETAQVTLAIILVWQSAPGGKEPKLVGAWPLAVRRPVAWLPLRALVSPLHRLCYVGTPFVDRACPSEVLSCMLAHLSKAKGLPKAIFLGDLNDSLLDALERAVTSLGLVQVVMNRRRRAKLESGLQPKEYLAKNLSAQRIKKLRQHRKRLSSTGEVTETVHRSPEEVMAAFEDFLVLESAGWKGQSSQRGLAIARNRAGAAFARSMVRQFAAADRVSIHALRVSGRPAAMQIIIRSGDGAFTWRTAYDETLHRCSPGVLLLEHCTRMLLSDSTIRFTDSCNTREDGYMAEFWRERAEIVDACIALSPGLPVRFWVLVAAEKLRRLSRTLARRGYHASLRLARSAGRLGAQGS